MAMATATMDVDEEPDEMQKLDALGVTNAAAAIEKYTAIVAEEGDAKDDVFTKRKELAIIKLGALLSNSTRTNDLEKLINDVKPFLKVVSKAKGSKLFRALVDNFLNMNADKAIQLKVCLECIQWCKDEKRRFLRQSLEVRLIQLYIDNQMYQDALALVQPLVSELKRLDDKGQLVQVQLMESDAFYALANYPKARAALVAAKTCGNAIYCPPRMQAGLDMQSGILHAQEGDFKTAYSYFYESFEGYDSIKVTVKAIAALKYMLLCKIMLEDAEDIASVVGTKMALSYAGRDLDAMQAVASAAMKRSLANFDTALQTYSKELTDDVIIKSHLKEMNESMLQKNLARIIEPFSRVEIAHIAQLISLPQAVVEKQLSQMILDNKLVGVLDQGAGCIEIFDEAPTDETYESALETMQNTEQVVAALYERAQQLF